VHEYIGAIFYTCNYIFYAVFNTLFFFNKDVETVKLLKAKEGGENVQILTTCSILERTLRTNRLTPSQSLNVLDINCLEDVAGIRAALDVLSTYLGDDFVDNFKRLDGFSKCLEAAKYMCNDPNRSTIQLFLLKQLVRHDPNGLGAVQERCKRKELKWIMPPQAEVKNRLVVNGRERITLFIFFRSVTPVRNLNRAF
jgi:hypothetical protein